LAKEGENHRATRADILRELKQFASIIRKGLPARARKEAKSPPN
jgi:hypothetical protein